MLRNPEWKIFKGWKIRIRAVYRCLFRKQFVLVCWIREKDGDITFLISHKGVEIPEAIYRLKVDAVEILQDIDDQNSALDEVDKILK